MFAPHLSGFCSGGGVNVASTISIPPILCYEPDLFLPTCVTTEEKRNLDKKTHAHNPGYSGVLWLDLMAFAVV